jgi:hypothetical protein
MASWSPKKKIHLNAFDLCSVGHTCPGQWRNPQDRSTTKRDLRYWINLAQILEKGKFLSLFLADNVGGFDVYEGSRAPAIRAGSEFPVTDPFAVSLYQSSCPTSDRRWQITTTIPHRPCGHR